MPGTQSWAIHGIYGSSSNTFPKEFSRIVYAKDILAEPIHQTWMGALDAVGDMQGDPRTPLVRSSDPTKPVVRWQRMLNYSDGRPDVFQIPIYKNDTVDRNTGRTKHYLAKLYDNADYALIGSEGSPKLYYTQLYTEGLLDAMVVTSDAMERTGLPLDEWMRTYGLETRIQEMLDLCSIEALLYRYDPITIRARYSENSSITPTIHPNRMWATGERTDGDHTTISVNDRLTNKVVSAIRKKAKQLKIRPVNVIAQGVYIALVDTLSFEHLINSLTESGNVVQPLVYQMITKSDDKNVYMNADQNIFLWRNILFFNAQRLPTSLLGLYNDGLTGADPVVNNDQIIFTPPADSNFTDPSWSGITNIAEKLVEIPILGAGALNAGDNNAIKDLDRELSDYGQIVGKAKELKVGFVRSDATPSTGLGTNTTLNWSSMTVVVSTYGI